MQLLSFLKVCYRNPKSHYLIIGVSWAQNLFSDDKGVATFKGIPFMTSGGPCTASIPKASIK